MWWCKLALLIFTISMVTKSSLATGGSCPGTVNYGTAYPDPSFMIQYIRTLVNDFYAGSPPTVEATYFYGVYWTVMTEMITSDIEYLYDKINDSNYITKFDFDYLGYFASYHCRRWSSSKRNWPYTCPGMTEEFVCKWATAMERLGDIVGSRQGALKIFVLKPKSEITSMTQFGLDHDLRKAALEAFFDETILRYIPAVYPKKLFYHTEFFQKVYLKIYSGGRNSLNTDIIQASANEYQTVKTMATQRCSALAGSNVAELYYCKVVNLFSFIENCQSIATSRSLPNLKPCINDERIMAYWEVGVEYLTTGLVYASKYIRSRGMVVYHVLVPTETFIRDVKNYLEQNDYTNMNNLISYYSEFVPEGTASCYIGWPGTPNHCLDLNCFAKTVYKYSCQVKFLLAPMKRFVNYRTNRDKMDLIIWLSNPLYSLWLRRFSQFDSTIDITNVIFVAETSIRDLLNNYNIPGLASFVDRLPPSTLLTSSIRLLACSAASLNGYDNIFCTLHPVLKVTQMGSDLVKYTTSNSVKPIDTSFDYIVLLTQLQLNHVSNKLAEQTQWYLAGLSGQVQDYFVSIGNYFSALADYDIAKSTADIGFISSRLETFTNLIDELKIVVQNRIEKILIFTLVATSAEALQKVALFVRACVGAANVAKWIGDDPAGEIIDALDEMMQAAVTFAVVGQIAVNELPDLAATGAIVNQKLASNDDFLKITKDVIDGLNAGGSENIGESINLFLSRYNDYSPGLLSSELVAYGQKLGDVGQMLCEAAFSGETAASAVAELALASSGDCVVIATEVAELMAVYEDFYDYQFDLMDALAEAARAHLAYSEATQIGSAYSSYSTINQQFLREYAMRSLTLSAIQVWNIVWEYCTVLTYVNGGIEPSVCQQAISSPSYDRVSYVVSYRQPNPCNINNEVTKFVTIPTIASQSGDNAYLDLQKLYAKESQNFKIPNTQWLINNNWITGADAAKAIYIKRFEPFLPPMPGSHNDILFSVKPGRVKRIGDADSISYEFDSDAYTTRYTENAYNCYTEQINNPYAICHSGDIVRPCVASNGYLDANIPPSIFNEWIITADYLPAAAVAPVPATHFKIQVGITMCLINRSSRKRRSKLPIPENLSLFLSGQILARERRSAHCCSATQYWGGNSCTQCPAGSSQMLDGYYCQ